jgi:hypothetical protein
MREGLERKPWFSIDACWKPKRINCLSRTLVTLKDKRCISNAHPHLDFKKQPFGDCQKRER